VGDSSRPCKPAAAPAQTPRARGRRQVVLGRAVLEGLVFFWVHPGPPEVGGVLLALAPCLLGIPGSRVKGVCAAAADDAGLWGAEEGPDTMPWPLGNKRSVSDGRGVTRLPPLPRGGRPIYPPPAGEVTDGMRCEGSSLPDETPEPGEVNSRGAALGNDGCQRDEQSFTGQGGSLASHREGGLTRQSQGRGAHLPVTRAEGLTRQSQSRGADSPARVGVQGLE
jgi:hypothetical protein